nr:hypothetical protein [Gammaproteobacteria bacterium]
GETLPATDRSLNFRLTVRDGESGVAEDDVTLVVETTQGPFAINGGTLNTSGSYAGGTAQTIDWSVNNTDTACPLVDISLYSFSSDGSSYCDANDDAALNLGTHANSGTATVTLLDKAVSRGRVQVACSDNVFFALSAADIEVTSTAGEVADDCQGVDGVVVAHGTVFNDAGEGTTVVDSDGGGGGGGGALLLLPALLGFRLAASRTNPSRRAKLPGA